LSTTSRRLPVLGVGAALAALALVVAIAVAPKPADAAPRVVTKTFSSTRQITIPAGAPGNTLGAAAPYPSKVNAGGFRMGRILDVNVTLKNYSHTFPSDVDVMLSHRGVNRTVMSDVGGGGSLLHEVNNITLRLDDEAATSLPEKTQLTGGTFQPTNHQPLLDTFPSPAPTPTDAMQLSGFDGLNPNGTWSLWVVDDTGPDVGQFAGGWSIKIKARVRT
jgi:hypothetical protein